jgi:uncharacterized repeat protein (TIGR01451 family)
MSPAYMINYFKLDVKKNLVLDIGVKNSVDSDIYRLFLINICLMAFIIISCNCVDAAYANSTCSTDQLQSQNHYTQVTGNSQYSSTSAASFNIKSEFRNSSQNYPNPGNIVDSANYCNWVWMNIKVTNNGPDDSSVTLHDNGTGYIFYNPQIGWTGWVRFNNGIGWVKDNNFDVKTGTGTYCIPNGATYQIAILGYVNGTGKIFNTAEEISQNTNLETGTYPSVLSSINVSKSSIVRLKQEFRKDINGTALKEATYHDKIYRIITVQNQGPDSTTASFRVDPTGLIFEDMYAVSKDNGVTWAYNDGSFKSATGIWNIQIPSNKIYLLALYSKINTSAYVVSNVIEISQDDYNPYSSGINPKCLVMFDDGNEAQYTKAFQYMKSQGILGTAYVNGYNIGNDGVLTISQMQEMNDAGWIIGNHGYQHLKLDELTIEQIKQVLLANINYLNSIGLSDGAYHVAYPGGYYNDNVLDVLKDLGVLTGRSTTEQLIPTLNGVDLYRLPGYTIYNTTTVSMVKQYVDNAIQSNSTVLLLFHNILDSNADEYSYLTSDFQNIIDYIKSTGIECLNINELYQQATVAPISIPPLDLDNSTIRPVSNSNALLNVTSYLIVNNASADVAINLNSSKFNPNYSDKIVLTIKVTNNGPNTAENVTVGSWLDGNYFKYVSDNGNGTFNSSTGIWTVGDIESGESFILNITAQIITSNNTIKTEAIYNSGSTADTNSDNNYMEISLTVPQRTNIYINPVTGYKGDYINLDVLLTDDNNDPLYNKSVDLFINGVKIGTLETDINGWARMAGIAQNSGLFNLTAIFNQETSYSPSNSSYIIKINTFPTKITLNSIDSYNGDKINLIAKITDTHNNVNLKNQIIFFQLNGKYIGSATTDVNGIAILPYKITQTYGTYNITALFNSTNDFSSSIIDNKMNVLHTPTSVVINSTSGYYGDVVTLLASIRDTHKNIGIYNKTLYFYINGVLVGKNLTNQHGNASLKYRIDRFSGKYIIETRFLEDKIFKGSAFKNSLAVKKNPTRLYNILRTIKKGHTLYLTTKLTDTHFKTPINGKIVKFYLNNKLIGKGTTNKEGITKLTYKINQKTGYYTLKIYYAPDKTYLGSSNSKTLKIVK